MDIAERRQTAAEARELKSQGHSNEEIATALRTLPSMVPSLIEFANQYVPLPPSTTPTERHKEIALMNRQQTILFAIWEALDHSIPEMDLHNFTIVNREVINISKQRRALGGLDSPVSSNITITDNTNEDTLSIDAEVKRLIDKLKVND